MIYLTMTGLDLSFAISLVSQFMQHPRKPHWNAVMRILRYIKGYPGEGLLYAKHRMNNPLEIHGFVNAD